jgi:hypothetical protein
MYKEFAAKHKGVFHNVKVQKRDMALSSSGKARPAYLLSGSLEVKNVEEMTNLLNALARHILEKEGIEQGTPISIRYWDGSNCSGKKWDVYYHG